jgi:hypothetical protein
VCEEFDKVAKDGSAADEFAAKIRVFIQKQWKVDATVVKDIREYIS